MNLTIRPAVESDVDRIAASMREFEAYLRALGDPTEFRTSADTLQRDGFGAHPAFFGLVAESSSELIGYLLYHFGYDIDLAARTLHVIDLYVTAQHRRHGVGKALMMRAKRLCETHDVAQILWSVYKWNPSARRFYEGLGAQYDDEEAYMYLDVGSRGARG